MNITLIDLLNGDDIIDLVTANYGANSASVLIGNGNGTFQARDDHTAGGNPAGVAIGDFNGDGISDFATANNGTNNASVFIGNGSNTTSGVSLEAITGVSVTTIISAREAQETIDSYLERTQTVAGTAGAFLSRLHVAASTLRVRNENYLSAKSRIEDVDVAIESSNLVRLQILQQSGQAVLAKDNLQPQLVLELLKS